MPQELNRSERVACEVVRRVLGVEVTPWDVGGRRSAVDAVLRHLDGRSGALEITSLAADGAHQLDRHVASEALSWSLPGRWHWSIGIGDVRHLPRIRLAFPAVALWCEAHGIDRPDLWWRVADQSNVPDDVLWIAEAHTVSMLAHPWAPAVDPDGPSGMAWLTHHADAHIVDHSLADLDAALSAALADGHLPRRVDKLLAHLGVDDRHLYVALHPSALTDQLSDALAFGTAMPPHPPTLPDGITHLWLAPYFSRRVLLGTAERWTEHHPYDDGIA